MPAYWSNLTSGHSNMVAASYFIILNVSCSFQSYFSDQWFPPTEIVGIECGLLSRVSKKIVATKLCLPKADKNTSVAKLIPNNKYQVQLTKLSFEQ